MLLLGDMKVDVVEGYSSLHDNDGNLRLFRRKLLETDELDEVRLARFNYFQLKHHRKALNDRLFCVVAM